MMSANMMSLIGLVFVMLLYTAEGFTSNPVSRTVYEGDNVRFTCGSPYMTQCYNPRFRWYRSTTSPPSQQYISGCSVIQNPQNHMTVVLDKPNEVFHLDIQNVQQQDGGYYWCQKYYGTNHHHNLNSTAASLTVIPIPRSSPSCVTHPSNPRVGDIVSLTCTLAQNDPPSIITWNTNLPTGLHRLRSSEENQWRSVGRINHTLQETDNMKEFVCVAGPINTGQRCSVTPLQIAPSTHISPPSVTVSEGDTAVFTCIFEATPPVIGVEYKWQISKADSSMVKVNKDSLDDLDRQYNMAQNTLEILAVSAEFHNSNVTCRANYPQGSSISIYRSLLTVVSVTTVLSPTSSAATATAQETQDPSIPKTDETHFGTNIPNQQSTSSSIMATITQHIQKEENDTKTQQLPIGVLVGGVLAILLLLVTIILFVCFLVRSKRNVRRPRRVVAGSPTQESARQDTVTAGSSGQTDLTHLNLPSDDQGQPTQTNMSSEETAECEMVLYAIPDKTMRGEVKHFTKTPPANKTSTVSLPRDLEPASSKGKNGHDSHEMVVYAQVTNTNIKRYPKPNADKPASQDEDTEELNYADLDFNQVPQGAAGIDAIYAKPHKGPKK